MSIEKNSYLLLLKRLSFLVFLYFCCRLLFYFFNLHYFSTLSSAEIVSSFFYGIRFDITAIVITNTPIILLHFLPEKYFQSRFISGLNKTLFVIINSIAIFLNGIDFAFFQFTAKRATADVFKIISFGHDFANTVPKMVGDFWYILLLVFALWYALFRFYPKQSHTRFNFIFNNKFSNSGIGKVIYLLFFIGLYSIGFRGGIQYRPLTIISASKYGNSTCTPLLLNTPFTFVKTFGKTELEPINFMSADSAEVTSPTIHKASTTPFRKLNVVLIIMESFGKEYIGHYNNSKGYTPFLDSLIKQSYDCTNAYANAKRSIEGIPAITAGIPSLLSEPIITSAYSGNSLTSIASLLDTKNYETIFFHGGTNGTMGFDHFAKAIGYKKYFGRNEYDNDDDFDNNWGIFDEPFLHRAADELAKTNVPFFATLFTLSSHHPYAIPKQFDGQFSEGTLPIHKSIQYADYSLKKFFEYASTLPWYKNTLFVITADHTAISDSPYYQNRQGMYAIPIVYFMPADTLQGRNNKTSQQIDILPSIMSYLHYDTPYFAFGQSTFDQTTQGYAISYLNDTYQFIENNFTYITDYNEKNEYYQFMDDTTKGEVTPDSAQMKLKLNAFIQNYNSALINNKMLIR